MSSAIGGIGGMMGGMNGMQRPDPSQMADKLFSKLDTKGQGYIEKSDLQSAFDKVAPNAAVAGDSSADEVFKALDNDGDGKVTRQEMSDSVRKLADQLDSQFQSMRMHGMGGGGQGESLHVREALADPGSSEAVTQAGDAQNRDARMMARIMDLLKSYAALDENAQTSGSLVSTAA
ncbi:MAG: EF-hand domain-containing protein [Pseudomonadota bacterium]|nr:EF-hand domain-containing protein [Pseudomonadota bacterium]